MKNKTKEKTLIDIFNEKFKYGLRTFNLFNFYQFQYDVEEIVKIIKSYKIPFNMEFIRDQDTKFTASGFTGGSRYPDYTKNFVKVYILEEDYQASKVLIDEIKEKYTDKENNILDGIVIFEMENEFGEIV